jgi:hypothetical protein
VVRNNHIYIILKDKKYLKVEIKPIIEYHIKKIEFEKFWVIIKG